VAPTTQPSTKTSQHRKLTLDFSLDLLQNFTNNSPVAPCVQHKMAEAAANRWNNLGWLCIFFCYQSQSQHKLVVTRSLFSYRTCLFTSIVSTELNWEKFERLLLFAFTSDCYTMSSNAEINVLPSNCYIYSTWNVKFTLNRAIKNTYSDIDALIPKM
jgi:hypothetical protein